MGAIRPFKKGPVMIYGHPHPHKISARVVVENGQAMLKDADGPFFVDRMLTAFLGREVQLTFGRNSAKPEFITRGRVCCFPKGERLHFAVQNNETFGAMPTLDRGQKVHVSAELLDLDEGVTFVGHLATNNEGSLLSVAEGDILSIFRNDWLRAQADRQVVVFVTDGSNGFEMVCVPSHVGELVTFGEAVIERLKPYIESHGTIVLTTVSSVN
jgi:hypothetical protein